MAMKTNSGLIPTCGLKARTGEEVKPALQNMVEAAAVVRGGHAADMPKFWGFSRSLLGFSA
jgi:hypothetical protein